MNYTTRSLGLIAATAACCFSIPALADAPSNVALNGSVSITGSGFGDWSALWGSGTPASLASVTDGLFLDIGQQWNQGTVFWNGTSGGDANNYVTITLAKSVKVSSLILQVNNNDDYLVQYLDAANGWKDLATVTPIRGWGMAMGDATLGTAVTSSAFRVFSNAGDGYYSISEFQAIGTIAAVPEPELYATLVAGLTLIGIMTRRRR